MEQVLNMLTSDNIKNALEQMGVGEKLYPETEDIKPTSLRSAASKWNSHSDRRYRILQDEKKKLYVYRES